MGNNFKMLTQREENELDNEQLIEYYRNLKEYYENMPLNNINIKLKEVIHPILLKAVELYLKNKVQVFGKENLPSKNETCIYAFNHSNGKDFPTAASVVKNHFHILGDFTMKNDFKVDLINRLNGVVYVDRKSREDRKKSKDTLLNLLAHGKNIFIFPEGTWNLSPNLMMLPLNWGIIDIARISGVPIIPSVIDYRNNMAYVKIGEPMKIKINDNKLEKINELTDMMSTLLWDIMEMFPMEKREDIPCDYYETFIKNTLSTYSKLDVEYEKSVILKRYPTPEEVFEPVKKLSISKKNAFLFNRNYNK